MTTYIVILYEGIKESVISQTDLTEIFLFLLKYL